MGSTFNPQILVDKLSKLNSSQQSIETLSHWCIFHMNKAKQVVETWARQFHSAPREQRLAFLYLANDILQNSRRKGAEFVAEFWKVLPDALRDVMKNGDDLAKGSALRLINIWEERKVFGSRGQILKEEFGKRQLDNGNRYRKPAEPKLLPASGNSLEKLVSSYDAVYSSQFDEDAIFSKCRNAISFVEKVDKDVQGDTQLAGHINSVGGDGLKEQHAVLRECMEQLAAVESARANLVSLLQETLQEQVYKLDQVRDQLEKAGNICRQIVGGEQIHGRNGTPPPEMPQTSSVTYTRQVAFDSKSEDPKSAAAAMAAKLAASSSSAEMLTFVLSSLASEGVIGNAEKRAKLDSDVIPPPPPPPPYVPQDSEEPPPPPSSPPPMPPLPPPMNSYPPYMPMISGSYTYSPSLQPPATSSGYGPPPGGVAPPSNAYQSYPPEGAGGFYGQSSSLPMAPMSRQ